MEILEKLRRIKNPFTDQDIVSEGLVTKISKDGNKIIIYVAFARNTPRKPAAMAMVWPIQAKIVKEIVNALKDYDIEILDDLTLQKYYPMEEV